MPSAQPAARNSLSTLPNELLLMVVQHLVREDEDQAQNVRKYSQLDHTTRQTLYPLSLASRRFHLIFQPLLYQTIFIAKGVRHKKLFRTVRSSRPLGTHVKTLVVFERRDDPPDFPRPDRMMTGRYEEQRRYIMYPTRSEGNDPRELLHPDLQTYWNEVVRVHPQASSIYDRNRKGSRDAALEVHGILRYCPALRFFRHVIDTTYNWFILEPRSQEGQWRNTGMYFQDLLVYLIETLRFPPSRYFHALYVPLLSNLEKIDVGTTRLETWRSTLEYAAMQPRMKKLVITQPIKRFDLWNSRRERSYERKTVVPFPSPSFLAIFNTVRLIENTYYEELQGHTSAAMNQFMDDFHRRVEQHRRTLIELGCRVHDT
ncbi:hypothetical protein BJY01DRAFT_253308 [Aspergillus pseudoustus]|uniref:F-box domain-containing protein n=1 Tax=Aspergillus pseudoustus TaxID=1810923 RepID=A0ABR4J1U5_9EURO